MKPDLSAQVAPQHPLLARRLNLAGPVMLALVAMLVIAPLPAAADGIIIPRPPPDRPIPWREIPLAIRYHRVDVTIADQIATTRVDQVFVNEAGFTVEGVYVFPLPEDAAISSFDMWVDGRKIEGKLLDRAAARQIYEAIVRAQRDPALLEYVGRGAFQASIFPISAGAERRIQLSYTQALTQENGLIHYRYPLNTEKFSARDLEEVAVTVHLQDGSPLRAIYSPSHAVDLARDGERKATISYEARDLRPDRDFDLYYSVSPDAVAANLLTTKPVGEDGFFMLLVAPPLADAAQTIVPKDVVLVLDTSGSMDGEKIEQAKAAADYVLDHLGPADRFNIVAFSSATRLLAETALPSARRAEGAAFVEQLTAQGSTDINRALLEAVSGADGDRPTVLLFLTDGLPTAGETDPTRIAANVAAHAPESVRLFAFGVGYDVDTLLLDELSREHRGASSYVQPGEKIDERVSGFYAKVSAPVLVDVDLRFNGVRVEDIYPHPLPDLFAGSQLVVVGRYRAGGEAELTLSGNVSGDGTSRLQSYTYSDLAFAARGGSDYIPRLWAQRKIGHLLTEIRLKGASDELVAEVVELSTRYGIVTPYTSFLVEETELALSSEGRAQLGRTLQGGAAAMTPAAIRSGEQAVAKAAAESALRDSVQADVLPPRATARETLRQAGDKTFLLHDGGWVDTSYDADVLQAERILFGSERYFRLLSEQPGIGRYLALGDRVTVVVAGKAYAIEPAGGSPAPATPGSLPAGLLDDCHGGAVLGVMGAVPFSRAPS